MGNPTIPRKEEKAMEAIRTYDAKVDAKKRITLRNDKFEYYNVKELQTGTLILEPRELAVPFSVSEKTLAMMDTAVENLKQGAVSELVDLSGF